MGSRDEKNEPAGFDVEYCQDFAKAMGVKPVIVDVPFADRIPSLASNRTDIVVASTSDTMERALVVGFTVPYSVFKIVVLTRKGSGIKSYQSLKGHPVGGTAGTFEGPLLEADVKKWDDPKGSYRQYQSQADLYLAVQQGKIDAALVANTAAYSLVKSGKFPNLEVGGEAPIKPDYTSIVVKREEYGMLSYLNLFINRQYRSGRFGELWSKWVGGEVPALTDAGVYR
jgi:polar amino acid transport system substrate-binding protein